MANFHVHCVHKLYGLHAKCTQIAPNNELGKIHSILWIKIEIPNRLLSILEIYHLFIKPIYWTRIQT